MAKIRDSAVTIYAAVTTSMVCDMPVHSTGDLLVAFVNKDTNTAFTTPSGWTAQQTVISAGAAGGVYLKRAASSSETVTFTLTSETCCALVISVKNCNGSTVADAISASAAQGSDDSTLPIAGIGVTPAHNNTLVIHGLSTDSGIGPSAYPGWVNLFTGDTGANSLCVAYKYQKTAAAITAPDHWAALADDARGVIISIRDNGSETEIDPYIAPGTTPCTLISPLVFSTTPDKGTWELTTNDITSIGGKTMNQVDAVAAADSGYNPFRAATRVPAVSSTTVLNAAEMRFTSVVDMTANLGVLFGTFRFQVPRDYLDCSSAANGGVLLGIADAENDYRFWTVGAQFSKTTDASNRQNYVIEVSTTDSDYATSGTLALSTINDLYLAGAGYYGTCSVEWSNLYLLNEVVLAGGTAGVPLTLLDLEKVINDGSGRIPLLVRSGSAATLWSPIRFGGVDPINIGVNLSTFQFPRKADGSDYLDFHVSNNKMGVEFYGLSGDTLDFTNCVFTSDSPYYWRFNSSHNAGANLDFTGTTVVQATVTLRSTVSLVGTNFISCSTFTQNNAALDDCSFTNTKVLSDNPQDISNSTFTLSGVTQYGMEISATGTFDLDNNTWVGFGADGTSSAAIYNNSGGSVTLNIAGGTTPTITNGAGASTTLVVNPVDTTITVLDITDSTPIENSRVILTASDNTGPLPFEEAVSITRASSTATVTHTAHGLSNGKKVLIKGATQPEYNGVFTITYIGANSYSYTVSGTPATPATGSPEATGVIIDGNTNASGIITDNRSWASNQPVTGKARKATSGTFYKTGLITGTINSVSGFSSTIQLIRD